MLSKQVFLQQISSSIKGNFVKVVRKDLTQLKINLSFNQISNLSKTNFKKIVKTSCSEYVFQYLLNEKAKLSKGSEIIYKHFETQPYFQPLSNLTLSQTRFVFQVRTRNLFLKSNFPNKFSNITSKNVQVFLCNRKNLTLKFLTRTGRR